MHSQPRIDNNLERRSRAPREKTNQSAIKTPSGNNDEVRNPGSTSRRGRESMHNLGGIEPHHRPTWRLQVGDDEPQAREQLPGMVLHLRHYSSCGLPTGGLAEKPLRS